MSWTCPNKPLWNKHSTCPTAASSENIVPFNLFVSNTVPQHDHKEVWARTTFTLHQMVPDGLHPMSDALGEVWDVSVDAALVLDCTGDTLTGEAVEKRQQSTLIASSSVQIICFSCFKHYLIQCSWILNAFCPLPYCNSFHVIVVLTNYCSKRTVLYWSHSLNMWPIVYSTIRIRVTLRVIPNLTINFMAMASNLGH